MRIFTLTLAIFLLWFGSAVANDDHDHTGECEIVKWEPIYGIINFFGIVSKSVTIKGSTTCVSGSITIDLYEGTGESRTFIGTVEGEIRRYAFLIRVNVSEFPKPLSIEYSIEAEDFNDPPVITTVLLADATENVAYDDRVKATDPDAGDTITFAKVLGPDWMTVNSRTGALSGTPQNSDVGESVVTLVVTDNGIPRESDTLNTTITVINVNDPPGITTVLLADATENVAYDDRVKATDRDVGDTITFAKVLGPDWMTVGENGAVGGTPGVFDVGTEFAVSISVEDAVGAADTLNTSIAVIAKDVVVVMECKIKDLWWYSDTINFRRFVTIKGSATCDSGSITMNLYEGTGEFKRFIGTADGVIEGHAFSVTVNVSEHPKLLSIVYDIYDTNDPPVITTVSLADATEGVAYDDRVKATDPDAGDTITFAKVSGPDWMTVDENGAVGGTPGVSDVGSDIAVSISVEDAEGAADTLTTSIAVIAQDVVVMADPDIQNEIPIPADRSSISLDFSNNSSLSIAFTGGEVANQRISVKQISTSKITAEFPTVPEFTNAVHYIDINLDVHNIEAELTFGYDEGKVTGFGLNEDSLVVSVYDSLDARGFIWHVLPSTVDTDNNTITVTTDHFSLWAIASNTEELITSVDSMEDATLPIPNQFILEQNYPNPFNPTTTIQFNLPRSVHVSLKIYNALGQEVRNLIDTTIPAGENSIIWDGKSNTGQSVSSGLYFMKLQAGVFTDIKLMTFIK